MFAIIALATWHSRIYLELLLPTNSQQRKEDLIVIMVRKKRGIEAHRISPAVP